MCTPNAIKTSERARAQSAARRRRRGGRAPAKVPKFIRESHTVPAEAAARRWWGGANPAKVVQGCGDAASRG
eukprot:scaffold17254_cov99-Isochrysis_galbana.AAC.1